jgi:hypothetical protein
MQKLSLPTVTPRLLSMATRDGNVTVQIVSTSTSIVLDLQANNFDTSGRLNRSHAVAKFDLDDAMRLETALTNAIDTAWQYDVAPTERTDCRQTQLWSDVTHSAPVRRAAA